MGRLPRDADCDLLRIPRRVQAHRRQPGVAILPIVLAPVVVGLFWRTLMLSPNFGLVDYLIQALGFEQVNWPGAPTPALISVIIIHTSFRAAARIGQDHRTRDLPSPVRNPCLRATILHPFHGCHR